MSNLTKKPGIVDLSRVFLSLLLLLPGISIYARDSYFISIKDSLKSSLKGYYVEKVLSACKEDSCIGFAQVGGVNKIVPAYLSPSIEEVLRVQIIRSLWVQNDKAGVPGRKRNRN
ncbi:MAG: hypothetical protein NTY96_10265 [Bacteroidetes bacterium]|nr:hypothetical protein [Bacteroidota bacterium]